MNADLAFAAKCAAVERVRGSAGGDAMILNVAASVVVNRLLSWAGHRHDDELLAWTVRVCSRYGNVHAFGTLMCVAAPATFADAALRSAYDVEPDEVERLAARIAEAVAGARRPSTATELDLIDDAIDAAIVQLDAHDPVAAEHARAVSAWCARIARHLGCSDGDVRFARRAGLLADIGKLDVPAALLAARRPLSPEERRVMRSHAEAGERRVTAHPALAAFRVPVRSHHERCDGSGYPDGIDLRTLPLTTRILAVADAFNAMLAPRSYRTGLHPADALDELLRGAGTQYDPAAVTALRELVLGAAMPAARPTNLNAPEGNHPCD